MSRTVYLHVGLPKSGTSYIQRALTANKRRLRQAGLLFPGRGWVAQVRAVQDVRQMRVGPGRRRVVEGAWTRLVGEIEAWPGDAIVSMEWLAAAGPEQVRIIVDELRPAHVEVVFTVRDIGRTVPAAWQEFMQNRDEWTWEEFLEDVVAADHAGTHAARRFWAQQDLAALLATWTGVVPAGDVHVITVPHPGAGEDVLWHRLCEVIGSAYRDSSLDNLGSNASLGLESAEFMRRVNRLTREARLPQSAYMAQFKHGIAKNTLARRRRSESKLALPAEYHDWARQEASRQIGALRASGVHVIGDVEDLRPVLEDTPGRQPADVPAEELLDISLDALVAMAAGRAANRSGLADLRAANARLRERLDELEAHPGRTALRLYARSARSRFRRGAPRHG